MQEKLVSVIIPTYNISSFLKEAIQSLLHQSYKNFEIIVIDDGSDDNTEEVAKKFNDSRIKYLKREHTGSPAFIRNQGMKIAQGEYIAFLDSDDLWFPHKLKMQIKKLEDNEKLLGIATKRIVLPTNKKRMKLNIKKDKIISYRDLLKVNLIYTSSMVIRKSVIKTIGYFDEDNRLRSGQDYDYWLRIIKHKDHSILILKEILIKYRVHDSSITHTKMRNIKFINDEYKKLMYIYEKHKNYDKVNVFNIFSSHLYDLMILKKKIQLYINQINLIDVFKDKFLDSKDKLLICYGYYSLKYFGKILIIKFLKNHINKIFNKSRI